MPDLVPPEWDHSALRLPHILPAHPAPWDKHPIPHPDPDRDEPSALPTWPWGHLTSRTVPTAMSSSPQGHLGGTVPSLNATSRSQRRSVPSSGKCPTGCVTDIPGIKTFLPGTKGFGPPTQDQRPLAHPTGHPHGPVLVLPCRGLWCATAPRDLLSHSNGTQHGQGSFSGPRGPPGVAVLT